MASEATRPSTDTPPLVALRGIVKRFGTVVANDSVDLVLRAGEIHALMGENGAGKSTLVKILDGLLQPDSGEIAWNGEPITLRSPREAAARGIGMVFQHFSLFDNLSVGENIAAALAPGASLASLPERIEAIERRTGFRLDANRPVWTLEAGARQRIEVARALLGSPRLLILDEPTSVLTPQEAEALFDTLRALAAEGCAILYITHRLEEVRALCARATILRHGRVVATLDPRTETARRLAGLMVGAEVADMRAPARAAGPVRLEVDRLTLPSADLHGTTLTDISLAVRGGEIVGIAGVAGNGQAELFAALSGEALAGRAGAVLIDGTGVGREGIDARRRRGAAFLPEDRLGHAAVPSFRLSENVVLSRHALGEVGRKGILFMRAARRIAGAIVDAFDVRTGGADPAAATLSGGNLQKFVMGREIGREPGVLVVNQPTWGVDAAAAATIRQALLDLAGRGGAIVVISQDLDEIASIAGRVAVLHAGRLSMPRPAGEITREEIGLLMAGADPVGHAHAA